MTVSTAFCAPEGSHWHIVSKLSNTMMRGTLFVSGNKSEVIQLNASEIQMRKVFYKGLVKQILNGIKQTIREKKHIKTFLVVRCIPVCE